jgi:dATP pyrophosphohydrolase
MKKQTPTIVQTIVYRKSGAGFEVLLLKRTPERGGFWNTVNGTLNKDESIEHCRTRELQEETGITQVEAWSDELYRFSFVREGRELVVAVYAAQVATDTRVIINDEHSEFRWLAFEDAASLLTFADDKKALQLLRQQLDNPIPNLSGA